MICNHNIDYFREVIDYDCDYIVFSINVIDYDYEFAIVILIMSMIVITDYDYPMPVSDCLVLNAMIKIGTTLSHILFPAYSQTYDNVHLTCEEYLLCWQHEPMQKAMEEQQKGTGGMKQGFGIIWSTHFLHLGHG